MNLCINPNCTQQENSDRSLLCQNCHSKLLIAEKYRVIKRLNKKVDFGRTYQIIDDARNTKILKISTKNHPQIVKLFQREAEILSQLDCLGIPKCEGYFTHPVANSKIPLHCLIMEEIAGVDLETATNQPDNPPLDEVLALKWFKQLIEIIHKLHNCNLFDRDINPSNIIFKPDGQLVLIDFGAVRQVTATMAAKGLSTKISTPGYSAPEQEKGYGVPQSDFYALGRTFVYLLTGKCPKDIEIEASQNNRLNWRKYAPKLDPDFAELIDSLIEEKAELRPKNTKEILDKIAKIEDKSLSHSNARILSKKDFFEQKIVARKLALAERIAKYSAKIQRDNQDLSNKIKTKNTIIIVTTLIILGIVIARFIPVSKIAKNANLTNKTIDRVKENNHFKTEWISRGERVLLRGKGNRFRDLGVAAFKQEKYPEAVEFFTRGVQINRNDPEVQIYLNNARARLAGNQFTIATVVPIDSQQSSSQELLRGVADAQEKFNQSGGIQGRLVEIIIANDDDRPKRAAQIARKIVENSQVLAVVGHNSSGATQTALKEYEKVGLPVVSPVSSSIYLASDVFFRTILSDFESGKKLANYTKNQLKINKVAVFYNEDSNYSKSLLNTFTENFERRGGKVIAAIDISNPNFNPTREISLLREQVEAIALFPRTIDIAVATSIARANLELPGKKFQLIGGDTLYSSDTLNLGGSAVLGLIVAIPWFPENQPYAKISSSRWLGTINWRTATSYDATIAVLSSLDQQATRSSVLENLRQIRISAAQTSGKYLRFSPTGERQGNPVLVKVARDTNDRPRGVQFGFKLIQE